MRVAAKALEILGGVFIFSLILSAWLAARYMRRSNKAAVPRLRGRIEPPDDTIRQAEAIATWNKALINVPLHRRVLDAPQTRQ